MTDSRKADFSTCTNDPAMAKRHAPVHDMVTEILTRIEPDGYASMLEDLRAEHNPQTAGEDRVLALLADTFWRIRGCFYLETEILRRGMEALPELPPDDAMAKVFLRELGRGGMLSKLSRYESWLSKEQSRCIRTMTLKSKNRKLAESRMADSLARTKPCTSVIQ
ncbi:MAG: hypothetical protein ABSF64_35830 [Bryobacteraceae bacterium]|jgi:hypothetical protein